MLIKVIFLDALLSEVKNICRIPSFYGRVALPPWRWVIKEALRPGKGHKDVYIFGVLWFCE